MTDIGRKIQTVGQKMVSGDKYRYRENGYNLDLTYPIIFRCTRE